MSFNVIGELLQSESIMTALGTPAEILSFTILLSIRSRDVTRLTVRLMRRPKATFPAYVKSRN